MTSDAKASETLVARITEYLSTGGLFNPELAIHDRVRDLLIDCRDELLAATSRAAADSQEIAVLQEELRQIRSDNSQFGMGA